MSNESAAFPDAAWFEREADALRRLARALVRRDADADDLLQEGWLAAHELAQPPREPRAWMRRVLERLATRRALRTDARSARERAVARPEALDGPDRSLEHAELLQQLLTELAALAPAERRVLHALYLEGRTPRDAAAALGMNENTLRSHARRGLANLRERLDRRRPRDEWMHALALCIGLERGASATSTTSTTTAADAPASVGAGTAAGVAIGGGVMAVSMKWAGAAAIAIAALAWWALRAPDDLAHIAAPPAVAAADAALEPKPASAASGERAELATAPNEVAVATPAVAAAPATAPRDWTARGIVVDWLDRPVPGAEILAVSSAASHVVTPVVAHAGPDGRFEVGADSDSMIYASAPGYAPSVARSLVPPTDTEFKRYVLPAEAGTVEGIVTSCDGGPAAGIVVRVGSPYVTPTQAPDGGFGATPPGRCVLTDAAGRFRLDSVPRGPIGVRARAQGCGLAKAEIDVCAEVVRVELLLEREARLVGRVTYSDGRPVARASVQLADSVADWNASVGTSADGSFTLTGMPAGVREFAVTVPDKPQRVKHKVELVAGGESRWDPVLPAPTSRIVKGRLVGGGVADFSKWSIAFGGVQGVRLPGVRVQASGEFEFDAQDRERVTIGVDAPRSSEARPPVVVRRDVPVDAQPIEIEIPPTWDAVGEVRVRFVRADRSAVACSYADVAVAHGDGAPIHGLGARLLVQDADTGVSRAANLPAGHYAIHCRMRDVMMDSITPAHFELGPGEVLDLGELVLPEPGSVHFVVTADGAPFTSAFDNGFVARLREGEKPMHVAGIHGTVPERMNLLAGHYVFELYMRGDFPHQRHEFDVVAGRETLLDVALQSRREQRVRVLPKPGATPTDVLAVRMKPTWIGNAEVERPWTTHEFPRAAGAWERALSFECGLYELEVDAGAAGRARVEHNCYGALADVLTIQLE
ncbi:MAG: sigma-70 family RNA polymerase sigma factor [Planctomycetota bacterium]|nr:MAG: sigma-70 family RNA polymerase sigma factor [Planctomycetota bacterium]